MTISLGGAEGPNAGGHDAAVREAGAGGRTAATRARVANRHRAQKTPEMVAPEPTAKPAPKTPAEADRETGGDLVA